MSRQSQQRVIDAARAYIEEAENPAPDLVYRRRLRDALATAVRAHDVQTGARRPQPGPAVTPNTRPAAGQTWRRKRDGQTTVIISVPAVSVWNGRIHHRARRSTHTLVADFLRKYEFVGEATDD